MYAEQDLKLFKALITSKQVSSREGRREPAHTSKMFQVGLLYYLALNSGQSVLINVRNTRKYFSRNIHGARMFPQCFSVSHTGNIVSNVSFCFRGANYAYATRMEFNENPSMRALAKNLRLRASEHLSNFCEQFEQRPDFASTFKFNGTIRYPYF